MREWLLVFTLPVVQAVLMALFLFSAIRLVDRYRRPPCNVCGRRNCGWRKPK